MGVYSKILKQAQLIMRQNSFLWRFGLFFSLINISIFILATYQHINVGVILLLIFLVVLSFRVSAAIIIALKAVTDKQLTNLPKAIRIARFFYWRVLGVSLLIQISLLVLLLLFSTPVTYLNHMGQMTNAIALGIIGAILLLPVVVTALLIEIIAPLFIVVYDQKIAEAINRSYNLILQHWSPVLLLGIMTFLMQGATLFLTVIMLKLASGTPLVSYFLGALVYIILESFVAVFGQTAWLLLFLDLIKPQKFEAEQAAVAPEIVS